MAAPRPLETRWLGRVGYAAAVRAQERLVGAVRRGERPDTLLLLEHPPVVTLGRAADPAHLLVDRDELARRGVEVHECGRGGDVTYHGPGQLVGYPVVRLEPDRRDAHRYLRDLEQGLIDTLAGLGVAAGRSPGLTGVWVGRDKIAAIGVRIDTGWVTSHGFALNVTIDPEAFAIIVPCGIRGRGVTSLERETGRHLALPDVAAAVATHVAGALGRRPAPAGAAALGTLC